MESMSSPEGTARPSQVTFAGWGIAVAALLLLISVFDAMANLRSVDMREAIERAVTTGSAQGLGLSVEDATEILRWSLFVTGFATVAAGILGVFVLQRNKAARIGLTVAAVPIVLAALVTALDALASGRTAAHPTTAYDTLPLNDSRLLGVRIRNATIVNGRGVAPFTGDIGLATARSVTTKDGRRTSGVAARIADVGDLRVYGALDGLEGEDRIVAAIDGCDHQSRGPEIDPEPHVPPGASPVEHTAGRCRSRSKGSVRRWRGPGPPALRASRLGDRDRSAFRRAADRCRAPRDNPPADPSSNCRATSTFFMSAVRARSSRGTAGRLAGRGP